MDTDHAESSLGQTPQPSPAPVNGTEITPAARRTTSSASMGQKRRAWRACGRGPETYRVQQPPTAAPLWKRLRDGGR
jgi:hypothetical protein